MADKGKKAGAGKKLVKFFGDIKSELKKVVWPDRKKLTQSTITVLAICLIMAALVFAIDKVLSGSLDAIGFFPEISEETSQPAVSIPAASVEISSQVSSADVSEAVSSQE